jgi:hypothetical protein
VDWDTNIDYEKTVDKCNSPNLPLDPVYGVRNQIRAKDCRSFDYCGKEAHWFEQAVFEPTSIEDADLDDLSKIPFGRQA